jgi:uncharacterized membrane protein YphA (DoxX/SURF4 family)
MSIAVRVYGLAAVALGIPGLILGKFGAMGIALPAAMASRPLAMVVAAWLILAGLALNLRRTAAAGALALAALFALRVLALELPRGIAAPTTWVSWEVVAEPLVMALGGLLAFLLVRDRRTGRAAALARALPRLFGACLIVFGISEFVYAAFTASLVPAWLPPSQLFWAYLTGACQIAAGLAILSGVQARLAAILLTVLYLVFGLIVHLPRVIADPSASGAWSENGVNLVLAGAAWVLVDMLGRMGRSAAAIKA